MRLPTRQDGVESRDKVYFFFVFAKKLTPILAIVLTKKALVPGPLGKLANLTLPLSFNDIHFLYVFFSTAIGLE